VRTQHGIEGSAVVVIRPGVHSRGFGAYEEMAQSRLSLSRVEVTDRDDMPLGLHDPRTEAWRAEAVLDSSANKPGKAQALASVQAAAVTTDLAEITTALREAPVV
jgi:hypothetical protein